MKRKPLFLIRLLLGIALVGVLLRLYGAHQIGQALARERSGYFGAALAVYLAGQAMSSYRWQLLARINRIGGPWREYLSFYFIGMFTNLFVPGLIGGDAARATYLGLRHDNFAGSIGSVVADRSVGLLALFWFAAVAAITVTAVDLPLMLSASTIVIGLLSFLAYLMGPALARLTARLPVWIAKIAAPMLPYLRSRSAIVPALLLSLTLQATIALGQYLLSIGMGLSLSVTPFMLIVPIANVAASLPLTMNGLGVRESAYVLLFASAGIANHDAVALGLLWFTVTAVGGLTGLVPFVLSGSANLVEAKQPDEQCAELVSRRS